MYTLLQEKKEDKNISIEQLHKQLTQTFESIISSIPFSQTLNMTSIGITKPKDIENILTSAQGAIENTKEKISKVYNDNICNAKELIAKLGFKTSLIYKKSKKKSTKKGNGAATSGDPIAMLSSEYSIDKGRLLGPLPNGDVKVMPKLYEPEQKEDTSTIEKIYGSYNIHINLDRKNNTSFIDSLETKMRRIPWVGESIAANLTILEALHKQGGEYVIHFYKNGLPLEILHLEKKTSFDAFQYFQEKILPLIQKFTSGEIIDSKVGHPQWAIDMEKQVHDSSPDGFMVLGFTPDHAVWKQLNQYTMPTETNKYMDENESLLIHYI